ncbi:MAG: sulfur carrier protein ThiS [Eubacterium sp.]|nr:sulfur carrier protein ThiS [Eubacterium sp.]MEE3398937.1 sulfur carrier protein ThiS [Eubacterium sp.]
MILTVAGEKKEFNDGLTVSQLIEAQSEDALYVTVSINDEFVARDEHDNIVLKDGDVVEFLYFMGGGAR